MADTVAPEVLVFVSEARALAAEFGIPPDRAAVARFAVQENGAAVGWIVSGTWAQRVDAHAGDCPVGTICFVGVLADAVPVPERERPYWPLAGDEYIALHVASVALPSGNAEVIAAWRGLNEADSLIRFRPRKWTPADGEDAQAALRWLEGLGDESDPDTRALEQAVGYARSWIRLGSGRSIADFGRNELATMKSVGRGTIDQWMKRRHFNEKKIRQRYIERFGPRAR